MIPNIEILTKPITETNYPNRTYKIAISADRISEYTDDLNAIAQTVYLILSTERYQHVLYSWDYGVELIDLYGKPMPYVMSELPRRIKEALIQDDRISDVTNFTFEKKRKALLTKFTVVTTKGNISSELEVAV